MYLGRIVELAESDTFFAHPRHPYTAVLMSAVPRMTTDGMRRERIIVGGDVPSPIDPPAACVFHPRCPRFHPGTCDVHLPELSQTPGCAGHDVACHYPIGRWPLTEAELRTTV
jgi:oligopeptide/dipeptide ABC transporter ATP-binding protein